MEINKRVMRKYNTRIKGKLSKQGLCAGPMSHEKR